MLSVLASASKGAGTTDQIPVVGNRIVSIFPFTIIQDVTGGLCLHMAEKRVHIVLRIGLFAR